MEKRRLATLVNRAIAKNISAEERKELLALLADPANEAEAEKMFAQVWNIHALSQPVFSEEDGVRMLREILERKDRKLPDTQRKDVPRISRRSLKIAAAVLLMAVCVLTNYYYGSLKITELTLAEAVEHYGIEPGTDKAVLTLGDGRVIVLDDAGNGVLAEEAGVSIRKGDEGQLHYEHQKNTSAPVTYNAISIPRGGQYRLILPDGTKVHLNAESSLRYPTQFTENQREVELTGEGYFEVISNKKQPFYVKTPTQNTHVLGTTFNLSAYEGEAVKTTVVEGSVKVSRLSGQSVVLAPGQAAINDTNIADLSVVNASLDQDLAWQNGYFLFDNENIKSIMNRVARWYDIEVEYQGNMQNKRFGGVFQRSKSILQLLENFKETGIINFKIAGRRVIVMDK